MQIETQGLKNKVSKTQGLKMCLTHQLIITIPNPITHNSITYIFTNKFYNPKCNQTQQYVNLSSYDSSVSRILTLGRSHTNSDDSKFNSQSTTKTQYNALI
jgi:hypothetical protein